MSHNPQHSQLAPTVTHKARRNIDTYFISALGVGAYLFVWTLAIEMFYPMVVAPSGEMWL